MEIRPFLHLQKRVYFVLYQTSYSTLSNTLRSPECLSQLKFDGKKEVPMFELLISLSFLCPPVNAELLDSSGVCIALCVEGRAMECLTGPYDHFSLIKVEYPKKESLEVV